MGVIGGGVDTVGAEEVPGGSGALRVVRGCTRRPVGETPEERQRREIDMVPLTLHLPMDNTVVHNPPGCGGEEEGETEAIRNSGESFQVCVCVCVCVCWRLCVFVHYYNTC